MTITLKGKIETGQVWVNGRKLSPKRSQRLINHSPDGFSWGYGGSGPAQLALALLLKFTYREQAEINYQRLKWDIISNLPQTDFIEEVCLDNYL